MAQNGAKGEAQGRQEPRAVQQGQQGQQPEQEQPTQQGQQPQQGVDEPHANKVQAFRDYAREGIVAASVINSGAIIAILPQIGALHGQQEAAIAVRLWVLGLGFATICWLCAFQANAAYTYGKNGKNQFWKGAGLSAFLFSIGFFLLGGWSVSAVFGR